MWAAAARRGPGPPATHVPRLAPADGFRRATGRPTSAHRDAADAPDAAREPAALHFAARRPARLPRARPHPPAADVARTVIPADRRAAYAAANSPLRTPTAVPGVLLGIGLGGFVDGIVLHQILQWHNMLSAQLPPTTMDAMRVNMAFDGYFDAFNWVVTFVGLWALWAAGRRGMLPDGRRLLGQLVLGWGLFNLVEGVIDHHLLGLHHVVDVPAHVPLMDWMFLGVGGVLFVVLGAALARRA